MLLTVVLLHKEHACLTRIGASQTPFSVHEGRDQVAVCQVHEEPVEPDQVVLMLELKVLQAAAVEVFHKGNLFLCSLDVVWVLLLQVDTLEVLAEYLLRIPPYPSSCVEGSIHLRQLVKEWLYEGDSLPSVGLIIVPKASSHGVDVVLLALPVLVACLVPLSLITDSCRSFLLFLLTEHGLQLLVLFVLFAFPEHLGR